MSSTQKSTFGSAKRVLATLASAAMLFALLPAGIALAESPDNVCPPPGGVETFPDVTDGIHADNIECLAGYDLGVEGYPDGEYKPGLDVFRAQMATFIVALIEGATGEEMPVGEDHFADDDTSIHQENINKLAEAGVVQGQDGQYNPARKVNRAAMATFIAQAMDYVDDGVVEEDGNSVLGAPQADHFIDDELSPHEDNINRLADHGIVDGQDSATQYNPGNIVFRGQMASFIIEAASVLEELGLWAANDDEAPAAAAISLTPEQDTNPVGTDHTVTATVTTDGAAAEETRVRFHVIDRDTGDELATDVELTVDGEAALTYDGPADTAADDARDDLIVVCVVETATEDCFDDQGNLRTDTATDQAWKWWREPVLAALNLQPETDTNDPRQAHTVTATLLDQFGQEWEAAGETVRFEVYRNQDEIAGDEYTFLVAGEDQTGETGEFESGGEANFTYNEGAEAGEDDIIVACVIFDNDPARTATTEFCAEFTEDQFGNNTDVNARDDRPADDAAKLWQEMQAEVQAFPENDVNQWGTEHTVTALVTIAGEPLDGELVHFDVFRRYCGTVDGQERCTALADTAQEGDDLTNDNTDDDGTTVDEDPGEATFDYAGPDATAAQTAFAGAFEGTEETVERAEDTIVVCTGTDGQDCATVTFGQIQYNPDAEDRDQVQKTWTDLPAATDAERFDADEVDAVFDEDVTVVNEDGFAIAQDADCDALYAATVTDATVQTDGSTVRVDFDRDAVVAGRYLLIEEGTVVDADGNPNAEQCVVITDDV